jgi:hypothetical protein
MSHTREDGDMIKFTCPCGNEIIGLVCAKHENDDTVILTSKLDRLCYSTEVRIEVIASLILKQIRAIWM